MNKVDCANCLEILQSNKVTSAYVKILSRGGLTEGLGPKSCYDV